MFQRVFLAITALIAVVGVLQYRSISELSVTELVRQRANLQVGAARFSQEFNSEIMRAFLSVQVGRPDTGRDAEESAERIAGWMSSTPYRRIVRAFYRSRGGDDGLAELLRYDPAAERFVPAAWPAQLAELRSRLEKRGSGGVRNLTEATATIDEDVPAVIGMRLQPPAGEPLEIAGWSIAELDLEYIRRELFPELSRKHFSTDYEVRVVSRSDPGRVVYGDADPGRSDAADGLLDIRPEAGAAPFARPGAPGPPADPARKGPPFLRPRPRERMADDPRPAGAPDRGRWRLLVRHHAGSLEAAVARQRNRDLALSGLLLLLLAASSALLVISTRRAQRLAHQQMEFVAGVSHELRTPLTVISSAADNLADGVVAGEPQVKRYGSVIRRESRRLTDMVEQLLRFSGLQSGRAQYSLQPVDPEKAIERALVACLPELKDSGIEVQKDIQQDLPPVKADPGALVHCLGNLMSNAVKHAREGKWMGVSARAVDNGAPRVEFVVEDRGPGIDAEDLPHVWEPFFRGRPAVSQQIKGAGLGLSLVKRMTEEQGGEVALSSKPGEGAIFRLRFPVAEDAA
jgi:signal transduction histidine kinase